MHQVYTGEYEEWQSTATSFVKEGEKVYTRMAFQFYAQMKRVRKSVTWSLTLIILDDCTQRIVLFSRRRFFLLC